MNSLKNISLNKSFSILFGFQLALVVILMFLMLALYLNQINLAKSRDTNFNSYLLADELRQSSDDLTRMARAYVATGNPEFEREYWAILDIRNGKIPRPVDYNRIYWDFVAATGQKPRADGKTISLQDLMIREGFTAAEFEKLTIAQKNSDELVKKEMTAMNAIKGLYDDGTGNFTIKKEPDLTLANKLMNDEDYYKIKAEIMKPIDEFYGLFEERTSKAVAKHLQLSIILFWSVILLVIFILITFWYSFTMVKRQIIEREQAEKELSNFKKDLEQRVQERTKELEKLNQYMTGRELRMVELKKKIKKLENKENED